MSFSLTRNILKYSRMAPTALKLNMLYDYGKSNNSVGFIKQAAKFIKNEIPIRLARMSIKLNELPYGLSHNGHIEGVIDLYNSSFDMIMNTSNPIDLKSCSDLSDTLSKIKERHSNVQFDMGKGIQEWVKIDPISEDLNIDHFLDQFYMSRIGIRTLMGQYIEVEKGNGGIVHNCYPIKIINDAITNAKDICEIQYGHSPNVIIHGDESFKIRYIPSHLYYSNFELLKNSMKATVDFCNDEKTEDIHIYISEGTSDLIIKISDKGGGFSRNNIKKMFKYSFTTTNQEINQYNQYNQDTMPIMSGLGYGLPLSRLYCKYFQGDLKLIPYEGIGTDALIFINKLGNKDEKI